jgi:enterochelin esterase-like enzyme
MPVHVNGRRVTFTAPDDSSAIIGDFTDDSDRPIPLTAGESVTLEFPLQSHIEYAFLNGSGGRIADPDNPSGANHPWYKEYRSVSLAGYVPPLEPDAAAPQGRTESLSWASARLGGTRRAYVHLPHGYDDSRTYPVFYVQDGVAFRRTGRLAALHDTLNWQGYISPAILVFLEPADRTLEYFFNPRYTEFLLLEVLPRIEDQFSVSKNREFRGLWGASLGGLASLWTAMQHSDVFGRVVAQSAAIQGQPNQTYRRGADEWLLEQYRASAALPLEISMDCGQIEWLLGANRRFAGMLFDKGYQHQYFEHPSGHNWVSWRSGMAAHLEWLLG